MKIIPFLFLFIDDTIKQKSNIVDVRLQEGLFDVPFFCIINFNGTLNLSTGFNLIVCFPAWCLNNKLGSVLKYLTCIWNTIKKMGINLYIYSKSNGIKKSSYSKFNNIIVSFFFFKSQNAM